MEKETLKILDINPSIRDSILIEIMNKLNKQAEKEPNEDLWVFFDELTTCDSLLHSSLKFLSIVLIMELN